jgi:hypothetical protein
MRENLITNRFGDDVVLVVLVVGDGWVMGDGGSDG